MILFVLTLITILCQRLTQSRKSRFPAASHAAFQHRHRGIGVVIKFDAVP